MRSAVMILALLLVLGGIFFVVALRDRPPLLTGAESTSRPTSRAVVPSTIATLHPEASMIGQSNGVWMQTLDRRPDHVGRLAKEFRFERLDPRKDDAVDVTQPRARFYNDDGSIITLDGTDGVVVYSQGGDRSDPKAIGSATPDNGVFRNVTIRVFDTADATAPSTTAMLPAVRFDANDNRIATVDCVIDGRGVLADQVPVKVRGNEYEFDGRGLTMRWNNRDGRLEDLVVAHGERLLIRDVNTFDDSGGSIAAVPVTPTPTPAFSMADLFDGLVMAQPTTEKVSKASQRRAAARNAAAAAPVTTQPTTRRVKVQPLYYARFEHDVRVFRSGVQIATAETMNVALPSDDHRADAPAAAPEPTPAPTPPTATHAEKRDRPATRPVRREQAVTKPAVATKPAAATRPAEPLEIFWTGPLTVRPATPETTPAGGGKMVEFVGSPAHVTQGLSTIDARLIHVEPDAGLARVEPGGTVKTISLRLGEATQVRSNSPLLVDREAGIATIEGAGTMTTTDPASTRPTTQTTTKPTTARGPTTVTWNKRMELELEPFNDDPRGPQWLEGIELQGDASIESDAFTMNGDTLTFDFDEPDVAPTRGSEDSLVATPDAKFLRFASAEGHGRVEAGEVDDRHTLIGEEIHLGLIEHEGAAALTSILAEHDVAMLDARGTELYCDHLDVGVEPIALAAATTRATTKPTTNPTTRPAATRPADRDAFALVDRLSATGSVRLRQADGSNASGDAMTLAELDGRKTVALTGAPATAGSPRATLSSARLVLDPATNDVDVPGPGTLVSADPAKPGERGMVAWTDSMTFDNAAATIAIRGGVAIDNREATGATMHATSDRATLLLAATPTTKPTARATTGPSYDSLRNALLDGNVEITVDNAAYRHANVQTATLSIDVEHNLITADHPGRMLMFDQRNDPATRPTTEPTTEPATQPTTQSATQPTTAPASQPTSRPTTRPARSSSAPTSLAVAWRDKLRWDLLPGTLQMTGGVVVGYERGTPGELIQIRSRRLDATLAPIDLRTTATTTKPTTKPTTRAAEPEFELRTVHARDEVYVTSRRANFTAAVLDYDLSSDLAYATGDADRNVSVFDATGASRVGFSRITWNVQTGAISDFRDISGQIRR